MKASYVMCIWNEYGDLIHEVLICQECKDVMPNTTTTYSEDIEDCSSECEICSKK